MSIKTWREEFEEPGSEYRGAPFWAWNGRLDPEELRRQIRVMHRMGLGGFFMHSRVGLDTHYLSEEWFECVEACIDEAEKLDMRAWLYDEDRWPSGAAGGLVTQDPRYRARHVVVTEHVSVAGVGWDASTVAMFTGHVKGAAVTGLKPIAKGKKPGRLTRGRTLLVFRVESQACSDEYNGYTYLDTMNHEAVQRFITVTHEAYRREIGDRFGKRVPGIFTDEPHSAGMRMRPDEGPPSVPWTEALPKVFKQRYGYDLTAHLPELFYDVDGHDHSQARYHYHECRTFLFVDAFGRQIGDWCEKHGLLHTGHLLWEDTLRQQTLLVGDCMRFYEYMQAPGMDLLTEHYRLHDTAKQVTSVARQFGRRWRLTETYGCTGWDFSFEGHKSLGDWQAALGINLRCQHLSLYTMQGEAKRDYPASIHYQSPWWEVYSRVEDYFARLNVVLSRGQEVRDVLLLHPVESMWLLLRKETKEVQEEIRAFEETMQKLRDRLLAENIDFDYGNEEILSRHARIDRKAKDARFVVGEATYKVVVVPLMLTMRTTTLEQLEAFRAVGGQVVFVGAPASYLDAVETERVREFAAQCDRVALSGRRLAPLLAERGRRVSITGPDGTKQLASTLYQLRKDDEAYYLFVCNTGHSRGQHGFGVPDDSMVRDRRTSLEDVRISGFEGCAGRPVELDAETGSSWAVDADRSGKGWIIKTSLPPAGSRLFMIPRKSGRSRRPRRPEYTVKRSNVLENHEWDIILSENNLLVLDCPRYRIEGGPWRGPEEILHTDRKVRAQLGLRPRGGQMIQPWARPVNAKSKTVTVDLIYSFDVTVVPSGACFVGVECPDTMTLAVNGDRLSMDADSGWWCDRSLRRIPLDPNLLRTGTNELRVTCRYDEQHPGLEYVYILGPFGVRVAGRDVRLVAEPTTLRIGDWVRQGFPFYAGSLSYVRSIHARLKADERLFVQIPEYRGSAVRILVNGHVAGIVAWDPPEVDITDYLEQGKGRLQIEVIGHRRNSHGPLHYFEKWPSWTGPDQFVSEGTEWTDDYQLVPCGLMKDPVLLVKIPRPSNLVTV
ncbi:MAG: hypothetical protein HQ523_08940 [Lentisphaerae bacterium]|nr:hypothetical protein [Lentisphaerota bacterium]